MKEIVKRSAVLRRTTGPKPPAPTADEIFVQSFLAALQGCCSQFERTTAPGHKPDYTEGCREVERMRTLVRRSWNIACYSREMFAADGEVREFNEELFESIVR